ncbi:hypothetical protein OC846_000983 [Tilletia horrida]|uniref:Uncharacterized protein n=1 Tax=Tilletia horrida TaxID=155126 RepID=A0AAN6GUK5_9BASI|nr:hypothetical protein OC846_000983 [Tilletia horrida]
MAYGLTPQDAIPVLSDSEDERVIPVNDSSSDDDALGVIIKQERGSNDIASSSNAQLSSLAAAHSGMPLAPVFGLKPDREPEDWERASYLASQRAYSDIARYFRSGDAYFISLSLTPWESALYSTQVLDFGWAHLTEDYGSGRHGFNWREALDKTTHGRNGIPTSKAEFDAAQRIFSAFERAKARVSWKPKVVHYMPLEAQHSFNQTYYPNSKINFLFRAFAERVHPYPKTNVFHRQIDGTHVDRQDFGINELNRKLGELSSKKPVFLLTHCMEEDVNFLSKLGIAWENMNLSYPLSPWFTPKEDAEWLRDHAYWRFAWDFARPPPRQNESTSNSDSRSLNRENRRSNANRSQPLSSAALSRGAQASSDDDDDDRPVTSRSSRKAGDNRNFVFERARFTGGGSRQSNGHSSDESEAGRRNVPAPRRSFSPTTAPKRPRPLTRHQFYKPGTIHIVDIYALMEVLPNFSERSASYYPTGSTREEMNAGSTAEQRQSIAQQKKEELEKRRANLLKRATSMMSKSAGSNKTKREILSKSLLSAAFRTGVLEEGDGDGEQFKWWHGGNDAMYMLAILSSLVGEHPLPDRAPTPPPSPPRSALPSRNAGTSTRTPSASVLRTSTQQRIRRVEIATSSTRSVVIREENRSRTTVTQRSSTTVSSSSRLPASLPQRPGFLQSGNRRNAPTDAVEVPITAPSDIQPSVIPRRLIPPFESAAIRAQQEEQRRQAQEEQLEQNEPAERRLQSSATKRARPELSAPIGPSTTQSRGRTRSAAVLASNRIERLPSAVRNGIPLSESSSSSLSLLADDDEDDDEDDVRPKRRRHHRARSPTPEPRTPEPEALDSRHQFKPYYRFLHQLFEEPAIYISFAYRNAAPDDPFQVSEVGICILDASRADTREALKLNTSHLLVKEFVKSARPEAKTDFRYARGSDPIKVDKGVTLPSGTCVAQKRHITKAIHKVLEGALQTNRRVFAVLSMLDDEMSLGHQRMIGPDMWPVFYDWRTQQLYALGKDNEELFKSTSLWRSMKTMVSGSVPGTRGRKIYTIEIGSLFAAVNPEDDAGGGGAGGEDDGRPEIFSNIPFSQICDLLGIQPDADRGLDNAGNAAFFTMQAMLQFAYGPTDLESLRKEIK